MSSPGPWASALRAGAGLLPGRDAEGPSGGAAVARRLRGPWSLRGGGRAAAAASGPRAAASGGRRGRAARGGGPGRVVGAVHRAQADPGEPQPRGGARRPSSYAAGAVRTGLLGVMVSPLPPVRRALPGVRAGIGRAGGLGSSRLQFRACYSARRWLPANRASILSLPVRKGRTSSLIIRSGSKLLRPKLCAGTWLSGEPEAAPALFSGLMGTRSQFSPKVPLIG